MGTIAPAFIGAMKRLMGLKFAPANLDTHWEALSDLSADELDAAVSRAARDCDEFPSPKMLRAFVDEHRARVIVPEEEPRFGKPHRHTFELPDGTEIKIKREWNYYDDTCSDTGMRSWWCGSKPSSRYPWLDRQQCGRRKPHADHEWAEVCACASHNPDVQRKRTMAMQVTRKQNER